MNKDHFSVIESFTKSFGALFDGRILLRVLLPFFIAGFIGLILLITTWTSGVAYFENILQSLGWFSSVLLQLQEWMGLALLGFLAAIIFIFIVFIFFYFVILILTSLILVPLLLPVIEEKYFPELKKLTPANLKKMSFLKSAFNSIKYAIIYLVWLLISLPLFLIPGAQVLISFFLNSYLVKSLFPMDVFMDYVSNEEFATIKEKYNSEFWQLSFINNCLLYIPVLNLIAPVIMTLSFSIYGLSVVKNLRKSII